MMERMRKGGGEEPKQLKQILKNNPHPCSFWSGGLIHKQFNIVANALRIQTGNWHKMDHEYNELVSQLLTSMAESANSI